MRTTVHRCRARWTIFALALAGGVGVCGVALAQPTQPITQITVDVAADRRPISPLIYGVNWASQRQLEELNSPLNRQGGNSTTRYNWRLNASNRGRDWYFMSTPIPDPTPGERADSFIAETRAAGAEPMVTIPMIEWVARLGPDRGKLASFSIEKYGPQAAHEPKWFTDAGNGIRPDGSFVTGNDPSDANVRVDVGYQKEWVQHLVSKWGPAHAGGLRYYVLDNEPSIWHSTHRDVRPTGLTMAELRSRTIEFAGAIKEVDPSAQVMGPEEWGWTAYFRSGFDLQWGQRHGWKGTLPDRAENGDWPYLPWLLDQLRREHERTGMRLLDIFSVHFYPKGGESSDDVSVEKQLLRNRSTRALWDKTYLDESWIEDYVNLLPRLREWVHTYYPGTKIAITEYDWGAEHHISGAIAQADVLGIFGREGLDMATRWEAPVEGTPVFNAMRLYRNYDGRQSGFGDVSVRATVANPDHVAAFAAERTTDGAVTVMVLNKMLANEMSIALDLANLSIGGTVERWQLTATNIIARREDLTIDGNRLAMTAPAQSITLLVIPRRAGDTDLEVEQRKTTAE